MLKNVFEPVARALEYAKVYLFTILAGIVNLVGNMLLIPKYGVDGAIIATGMSVALQGLSITYYLCRRINLRLQLVLWRRVAEVLMLWLIVLVLNYQIETDLAGRVLANALFVPVLALLLWPNRWFSVAELNYIRTFIPIGKRARV